MQLPHPSIFWDAGIAALTLLNRMHVAHPLEITTRISFAISSLNSFDVMSELVHLKGDDLPTRWRREWPLGKVSRGWNDFLPTEKMNICNAFQIRTLSNCSNPLNFYRNQSQPSVTAHALFGTMAPHRNLLQKSQNEPTLSEAAYSHPRIITWQWEFKFSVACGSVPRLISNSLALLQKFSSIEAT